MPSAVDSIYPPARDMRKTGLDHNVIWFADTIIKDGIAPWKLPIRTIFGERHVTTHQ
jgi:hypothetical protein